MNKIKKIWLPILFSFVFLLSGMLVFSCIEEKNFFVTFAYAQSSDAIFDDGEAFDATYICGCCHSHEHSEDIIGRFACFFCKVSGIFKNIFGLEEQVTVHKYVLTYEKPATCLYSGTADYSCAVCGVTKEVYTAKLAHTSEKIPALAPTCTEHGHTQYFVCSMCNTVLTKPATTYAVGHKFGEYVSDNNASCAGDGTKTSTCFNCGETKTVTEEGTQKTHTVYSVEGKEPTCAEAGYYPYEKCNNCTYSTYVEIPALQHTPVTDKGFEPTCTETGLSDGTHCEVCGNVIVAQRVIEALGHKKIVESGIEPTCTEGGISDGIYCGVCGEVFSVSTSLPPKGHNYKTAEVPASCTEKNYTYLKCTDCGYADISTKKYGNINPTGHDFNDGDTVKNLTVYATGTDKVTASITCAKCSAFVEDYEISAAASVGGYNKVYHTFEEAVKAASNTEVYLLRDYILKDNITVNSGVTVVIPCKAGDAGYTKRNDDGFFSKYCPDNPTKISNPRKFRQLTVPAGRVITVASGGTLLINAVTGLAGGGQPESYGISDYYAQISLAGTVNVKNGGIFDCSGYTADAGGSVNLESGAKLFETYGILYWRGGSYGAAARAKQVFPIDGYEMNYMRAKLNMSSGAVLLGTCKMMASSEYHYCHFKLIGPGDGYLYQLKNGTRMERTVEEPTGKTVFKFYGDVNVGISSIDVGGVSLRTSSFQSYRMDGNSQMEFYDGTFTCNQKVQYMPGFTMVIGKGATLNITGSLLEKGSMVFCTAKDLTYNGINYTGYCNIDSEYIGSVGAYCPSDRGDAELYVKDGGKVHIGGYSASLAGKVYVDSKSSVSFADGAKKEVSVKVAVGELKGVSVFSSVSTKNYTVPYMQFPLN